MIGYYRDPPPPGNWNIYPAHNDMTPEDRSIRSFVYGNLAASLRMQEAERIDARTAQVILCGGMTNRDFVRETTP